METIKVYLHKTNGEFALVFGDREVSEQFAAQSTVHIYQHETRNGAIEAAIATETDPRVKKQLERFIEETPRELRLMTALPSARPQVTFVADSDEADDETDAAIFRRQRK